MKLNSKLGREQSLKATELLKMPEEDKIKVVRASEQTMD